MIKASEFQQQAYDRCRAIAEDFRHSTTMTPISDPTHAVHLGQACAADAVALEILGLSLDSPPTAKPQKDTPK